MSRDGPLVQHPGDFPLGPSFVNEHLVNPVHQFDLLLGPGNNDNAIGLNALEFARLQDGLVATVLIHQHPAQPNPGNAALPVAQLDQAAGPLENLVGKFPAEFTGHGPLHTFNNGRGRATVILKLLRAVMDLHPRLTAEIFIIGTFVGILEPAPPAHVIDEDTGKASAAALHVPDHLRERIPPLNAEPAFAVVGIDLDDLQSPPPGVFLDNLQLVAGGILLMLSRHPHVGGRAAGQRIFVNWLVGILVVTGVGMRRFSQNSCCGFPYAAVALRTVRLGVLCRFTNHAAQFKRQ